MAISTSPVQQQIGTVSSSTSFNVVMTNPIGNGNLLVLGFAATVTTATITGITQTGASWQIAKGSHVLRNAEIWYAMNVPSSASQTIAVSCNTAIGAANVSEWSGAALTSAADQSIGNSGTSVTPATGSITPTLAGELIIGCSRVGGAESAGPTGGFTGLTAGDTRTFLGYLVPSVSGAYSTSWTAGSGNWEAVIASFFVAASATHGLFLPNPHTGLGVGGPFFSNSIG